MKKWSAQVVGTRLFRVLSGHVGASRIPHATGLAAPGALVPSGGSAPASTLVLALTLVLAPWACGDSGSVNNNVSDCPAGHLAEGPACVPIFDDPQDCPGPNQMPVLGGGCGSVGVLRCAQGFVKDGEGGCEPILPPSLGPQDNPCPPGTMEEIGTTECQPVGVIQCAPGFISDGEGGCEAILPPGPLRCPRGTIEQIGQDTCQPLGQCGPDPTEGGSPWGLVEVDGTTVYVDSTADATGANGTAAAPFTTVGEALGTVQPGGKIAIAAGDYQEVLVVNKPVELLGRCSHLVTLRGRAWLGQPRAPVRITQGGSGSQVRGVTLTGPGEGLEITSARQVLVEEVEVIDTERYGVVLLAGAEATIRRTKVMGCNAFGVGSLSSDLRVEQSVVADTLPQMGTGGFGRGINAACDPNGQSCGSVHLEGSLVAGNRNIGVFAEGAGLTVVASVVTDTLSANVSQLGRAGISVTCSSALGICGPLLVEGSLVAGNQEEGIHVSGPEATVVSSAIRDTQARDGDQGSGMGISSSCHGLLGVCGALRVEGSLVAGNRTAGIASWGVDTTVISSVVRDTLSQESDHLFGRAISSQQEGGVGECRSLHVERCLVTGNREAALFAEGVDLSIVSSVVRDTQSGDGGQDGGYGVVVSDILGMDGCGSVHVQGSLVANNREVGILVLGVDSSIFSSVVWGTLAREISGERGWGIGSLCNESLGTCGFMHVDGTLVAENREVGIVVVGGDASVVSSVVRDTLPAENNLEYGRGITVNCAEFLGVCGLLHVEGSLVARNREMGIFTYGVDTNVVSSVVRDTQVEESHQRAGVGIGAYCGTDPWECGSLRVEGSLLVSNREVGIAAIGADAQVLSSVVQDTQPTDGELGFGRGINAQCDLEIGACGSLAVSDTLVVRSEDVGIYISGGSSELTSVAVVDTKAMGAGLKAGERGQGIWAVCGEGASYCGSLSVTASLVAQSHGAGLAVQGVTGFVTTSLVVDVVAQPKDGKYGYGFQIGGVEDAPLPTFHVQRCVVRDAKLAGVLYYRSQGVLSGSVVSGGEYSVAMNEGSLPTIVKDNQLSGTVTNDPQWVSLYPAPAPAPTTPSRPLE